MEEPEEFTQFDIIESEKTKGEIFVSSDIAICDECKEEMFDPKNRRYLHPFINCTCLRTAVDNSGFAAVRSGTYQHEGVSDVPGLCERIL